MIKTVCNITVVGVNS